MKIILSSRRHYYVTRLSIFLITVALIAGIVGCGDTTPPSQTIEIKDWFGLNATRNNLGGSYILVNNLDSKTAGYNTTVNPNYTDGSGWKPIGTKGNAFKGTFDGNSKTISDLFIDRPKEENVGLFGYVSEGGVIKNVGLVGANVTGSEAVGGLVGYNHFGSVGGRYPDDLAYSTNSTGGSVAGNNIVGGLVGWNWGGIVSLCESSADVFHRSSAHDEEHLRAGGLVGRNSWGGTVVLCHYNGSVVGDKEVGGLVGLNTAFVLSSYISCNVTGSNCTGGAVGRNTFTASLHNVKFEGFVNGNWTVEIYVALNEGATGNAYSSDTALPGSYVGGVVGLNEGSVGNCVAVGSVVGNQYVGGLVGYSEGAVENSCAAARVEGSLDSGGFMGKNDGTVANSFWDSEASGTTTGIGTGDPNGIISKSTRDMKDVRTYRDAGWDIWAVAFGELNTDYTWNIVDGVTYPFLSGKQLVQYDFSISSTEGGEVTSPGEGTFTYYEGTVVNLAAEAKEGYRFDRWTGSVSTIADINAAETTITMNGDYTITANFEEDGEGGITIPLKNPGSFVQMMPGDIDSLDPAWSYDTLSCEQVQYIYETLLFYDGEEIDQFVPILATEWELLDDDVTYRFKIREGVKWHEGGDLTPLDVEYSFERAMIQDRSFGPAWLLYEPLLGLDGSRDGNGNIQVTFGQIDNAVEVDGDWVVFHLSEPAWGLAFLQILCGPWASIVDKERCIANGEWDGTEETWLNYNNPDKYDSYLYNHTNGTGPWKLEEWELGVQIKLVRFDDYWREPAAFERVITQVVDDWFNRKLALLNGDADFVYVPLDSIGELEGIADLTVYQDLPQTPLNIDALFFNMAIAEDSTYIGSGALDGEGIPTDFFTDIDVRKGFNYAFDWEAYINYAYMGEAEQRGSPIIEGLQFYNPDASMYSLDLDKAEEHLKAAWAGEVWEKGFKFTLLYNTGSLRRETACEILAENLAMINPKFQISVEPIDYATYAGKIWGDRDMPMFQIGWAADYPDPHNLVVPFMASYGVFAQWQGYSNSHVDDLIAQGTSTMESSERQAIYYELQQIYYEDAPSIMLVQPLGRRYFTKYIHGFYFNPFFPGQAGPLYYMSKSSS